MLAAVPIKPFGVAKARLAPMLDASARSRLGKAVAANTLAVIESAGVAPAVVTASDAVATWASGLGVAVIRDPDRGLSAAAAAGIAEAHDVWGVFHADLPWLSKADVAVVANAARAGYTVLAPSADGGTNVVAGGGGFRFRYGPESFSRHLAASVERRPRVLARPGLALDLDTPRDYQIALSDERGAWLLR